MSKLGLVPLSLRRRGSGRPRRLMLPATLVGAGLVFAVGTAPLWSQQPPGGIAQVLTPADVTAVITAAASAVSDDTMSVAVVDRAGTLLGVYARPRAIDNPNNPTLPNVAVSLARTVAYFSNDQAPLSSRTVRFISGIHFPAGARNTPNAPLYGVENINRGCDLGVEGDAIWNPGIAIDRPRSLAGTPGGTAGLLGLPCQPSDTRGCAVGGPILGENAAPITSLGITTGKRDLRDSTSGSESAINPGGIPLYRGGKLIGGVGVSGIPADRAQFAALRGAAGNGRGITTAIAFPDLLPEPGAIYIDGLRLPFYGRCGTFIDCIEDEADRQPLGSTPGQFSQGSMIFQRLVNGRQAPEGYLIGPRADTDPGGLTSADVQRIVSQATTRASEIRAQVRLPLGQTPSFIIAVTGTDGRILAEYRMVDSLFDAVDVVPSKARNAYYFSSAEGYRVLRDYVETAPYDRYSWEPSPPAGQGWALTSRTISFGGQPLFPPGIDLEETLERTKDRSTPTPGPWFDLFVFDTLNPCTEGPGTSRGGNRSFPNQNGITWFPGSAPLYKNGRLVGGVGVSGDGVDQNDLVTAGAAAGFEPPDELRVDRTVIRTGSGEEVRLPYLKYPRNPETR